MKQVKLILNVYEDIKGYDTLTEQFINQLI